MKNHRSAGSAVWQYTNSTCFVRIITAAYESDVANLPYRSSESTLAEVMRGGFVVKHNLNSSAGIAGHYRFSLPHHIQTVSYPNAPIPLANTPDPVNKSGMGGVVHLRHTPSLRGIYQKHRDNFPSTAGNGFSKSPFFPLR